MIRDVCSIAIVILLVIIVIELAMILGIGDVPVEYDIVMSRLDNSTGILGTWSEAGWHVAGMSIVQGQPSPYLYVVVYR